MSLSCSLQISTSWHFELCFIVTQIDKETRKIVKEVGGEQSGAAEACWAHNPEVNGSKPFSAKHGLFCWSRSDAVFSDPNHSDFILDLDAS